jgi:alkanesulfonate monooxygenase SsuD/methylene tetrahydromethanopterin reductase-like flavin-dependent oxidoreductase (luciferase family)
MLVLGMGFRNPALFAKMADTVDEITGGRLILGVGAGYHKFEYDAFGFPFDDKYSRFAEAIQIVHGLLKTGHIDFHGKFYSARDCELKPRGPRPQGPPIMFGQQGPQNAAVDGAICKPVERLWG